MSKRFKWAILALLGFSTACSTVKNTAKGNSERAERADSTAVEGSERPQIIVMYGVRPPAQTPLDKRPMEQVERSQSPTVPESSETGGEAPQAER